MSDLKHQDRSLPGGTQAPRGHDNQGGLKSDAKREGGVQLTMQLNLLLPSLEMLAVDVIVFEGDADAPGNSRDAVNTSEFCTCATLSILGMP